MEQDDSRGRSGRGRSSPRAARHRTADRQTGRCDCRRARVGRPPGEAGWPEARKTELARLTAATPHSVPALHPNLAAVYRMRVAALHDALNAGDAPDALEAV